MMARFFRATILIAFIFSAKSAFAACHVVTPSGSGSKTGADWNNAYAGLPSTLTRGDVYYLADGAYGSYTISTPDSGTTVVEIRKAQTYDNCTSTGWSAATMGSSQASFTGSPALNLNSDWFILNGNGTYAGIGCGGAPGPTVTSEPPNPSDCGIRLAGSSGALNVVGCCGLHNTLKYIELVSSGTNNINGNGSLAIFAGIADQSSTFFTIQHMYARNEGCVYIQDIGSDTVVDHSYFWGTEVNGAPGSSACHGQSEYSVNSSRGIRSYNVQRDITGTAVWTFGTGGTFSDWQIYGNIIFMSSPTASWGPYLANGVIACINAIAGPALCQNLAFYDNTIVVPGSNQTGILSENSPSSYIVRDNLWYASIPLFYGSGFSGTQDHNSFLAGGTSCPSGTANVCNNASPNPFTNWPGGNFTLASDGANWNNRLSLGAPYDTDAAGKAFTSDRGAHQYSGSVAQVQPPTGLVGTVN